MAQDSAGYDPFRQQEILQQERQRALEQQLVPPRPSVRLFPDIFRTERIAFPEEKPCFQIKQVSLDGQEILPFWLSLQGMADWAVGECVGSEGINLLMSAMQNRLVGHGYVTTRVLAPAQDLTTGVLQLVIVPGTVRQVALTPESDQRVHLGTAFPVSTGQLLDLRDIEQGLENLQRVPTVQASMEILPGEKPGESDVMVTRQQSKWWRVGLTLDDSGSKSTGRYQGGATLYLDNPLSLSDLFYFAVNHDLEGTGKKGTRNLTGHYSVPFGYWTVGVTASDYNYHQTVAGAYQDYRYSGDSKSIDFQISRVIHRGSSQKTTVAYHVLTRESRNYINDTEVEVQRRRTSAWRAVLQHRHYIGAATLDADVSYQYGTRWFGALRAPEEEFDEATALSRIFQYSAHLNIPFQLFEDQKFRYDFQMRGQHSHARLTPQDQFSIGSRWTVRGFDGERTLSADNGWYVRNELAWSMPIPNQELYFGADYGRVNGRGSRVLAGNYLAGGAMGIRGYAFKTSYEFFAATPFSKPKGFDTDDVTVGFNLNWQF